MTVFPRSPPSVTNLRRLWRFYGVAMAIAGAVLVLVALDVFVTQGSQLRATATVLSEHCHPQRDLATGSVETRCDAVVRYATRSGQVITATVTDAFPYEFRHQPGRPATIQLRYDSHYPADPFKQSNYMSAGEFALMLGLGVASAVLGVWWVARANQIAENAARRRRARYA